MKYWTFRSTIYSSLRGSTDTKNTTVVELGRKCFPNFNHLECRV